MDQVSRSRLRRCAPGRTGVLWLMLSSALVGINDRGDLWAQQSAPAATGQPGGVSVSPELMAKTLSEFNRGCALMEQYKYSAAVKAFEAVLQVVPDWTAARFNLALAYLNMQGAKDSDPEFARQTLQDVLEADPGNLHALFCLGMYYQHEGEMERAMVYFARVYLADPDDPYVGFKYAEALLGTGATEEGVRTLEKVIETDPGFISAIYRLALQYRRTKGIEEAKRLLTRFKELDRAELAEGSFGVDKVYGMAGKYYRVLGADGSPLATKKPAKTPPPEFSPDVFEFELPTVPWDWDGGSIGMPGIAVADVDRDGDLDLFLTATRERGGGSIWLNDGSGRFARGAAISQAVVSASFGDVDNDGDDDLWLGGIGEETLLLGDGSGMFEASDMESSSGGSFTPMTRLIDIDSDGDLDLCALRLSKGSVPAAAHAAASTSSIYNNNGDGSYRDVADALGLQFPNTPISAFVCDDFDNDRDLDIVAFPVPAPGESRAPFIWRNDRVGAYRLLDAAEVGLPTAAVISATTGDPDKDGDRDLLLFTRSSTCWYENLGRFRFRQDLTFRRRHGGLRATGGQFVDMDNDGDLDLVMGDAHRRDGSRGPVLLVNNWPSPEFADVTESDPGNLLSAIKVSGDASCIAADFTNDGRCDLLLAAMGARPQLIRNATRGGHWISIDLRGKIGRDQLSRSNNSAVGARVEVKTGGVYQQHLVGGNSGPVAALPLRVHAGLGDNPKVDWLSILWPDAVLQAETEVAGNQITSIVEENRKESSCPYLFAWNGDRFEFVADFGGVGGLGYLVAPGTYAPPDPTEYVPVARLQSRDGHYVLNAITVLEEVTYFDEAKLISVDHPIGTRVVPNEMMAINTAPPDFEVFCFQEAINPVRAHDHHGSDVTRKLATVDRRYAGATRRDVRFDGFAEPHYVELDFGDRLSRLQPDDRLIFVAHGWVEYGYSSTNYAAAQAGLRVEAPTISAFRNGQWVELFNEVGYPAGTQHVMTLDVSGKVLPTDRKLRVSSNMDLYWDQIQLAVHQRHTRLRIQEVAAQSAELQFFGFPREYSPDGHHPNLSDYENVDRNVNWKLMSGDYTRYGDVTELVARPDDCFVIMGHGEQLTLKFPASAFGPVPAGYCRSFLLKTDSYCKDMDLFTAHPDSVEPLPFHAMSGYPYAAGEHYPDDPQHEQYRREYNTRRVRTGK